MESLPELTDRVCLITGANAGIGKATALRLAQQHATVIMACRSVQLGQQALAEVKAQSGHAAVELMVMNLAYQKSIRSFVTEFKAKYPQLHVLINNAANFDHTLKQATLTSEGIEVIFATNHLGPFLLTNLLLDRLQSSAPARIINVASKGLLTFPWLTIAFDNLNGEKKFNVTHAYYHSKLAQVMFTYDLARRLAGTGVTVNCIRVTNVSLAGERLAGLPGWMQALYALKRRFAITPEKMAETYAYLAASPTVAGISGKYWDENNRPVTSAKPTYDEAVWQRLWEVSAKLTHLEATREG